MKPPTSTIWYKDIQKKYTDTAFCGFNDNFAGMMAGIYLHIPFCKTRCAYCDFFSTTGSNLQQPYTEALCQELNQRKDYLQGQPVETIYIGGGTPSQLTAAQLESVFKTIDKVYGLRQAQEITLEANPDDLTEDYVRQLSQLPVNRISMGVQTFNNAILKLLNRRHNAAQVTEAMERCRRHGFNNISIDLIYGLPGENEKLWLADLQKAIALQPQHISAYHLTYEEGTPLHRMLQRKEIAEVSEEQSLSFFKMLRKKLMEAGYDHYEISNFCLPGYHSRHNSSYWTGTHYLGCGAAAHSFNGISRQWNVASLSAYIEGIKKHQPVFEMEELNADTRYNELIMTGLRTAKGIDTRKIEHLFGKSRLDYCLSMAAPHLEAQLLQHDDHMLRLTEQGIFVSDSIISDLMYV